MNPDYTDYADYTDRRNTQIVTIGQGREEDTVAWISAQITTIMLVSGILTCSGFYALVAPHAAVAGTYGAALDGPIADVIVRNWGALIGMVGLMLVYGAYRPAARPLVLVAAIGSKVIFISLVLAHGSRFLSQPVRLSIAVDLVMVAVFLVYLAGSSRARA
jgi:hypothetical protein